MGQALISQHLLLVLCELYLLRVLSTRCVSQLCIAGLMAMNACVYTFTHTVGTESLSLSSMLLLAGVSLRMFRRRHLRRNDWLRYVLALALCASVRHINGILPMVLPFAYLLVLVGVCARAGYRWHKKRRRSNRSIVTYARTFGLAFGCGLVALLCATIFERGLCSALNIDYHSVAGHAFSWRLNFLAKTSR